MRLICPNCVAQYEVDQDVIPAEGRDVQCANCGHNWFQDSIQMFSADTDAPLGTGDPDSDVPPELFNDLEGKLSTPFASARANVAPNPDDLEPEEPRDDFQIEQEPSAPSSRMDQSALDMIREEAEYSSGEKPPAAEEEAPDVEEPVGANDLDVGDILNDLPELPEAAEPEMAPLVEDDEEVTAPAEETPADEIDDMDEIRRRIMELENTEDVTLETPAEEEVQTGTPDDLVIPDLEPIEADTIDEPIPARPSDADNPFTRPTLPSARAEAKTSEATSEDTESDDLYQVNIPLEEELSDPEQPSNFELGTTDGEPSIDAEITALVSEKDETETGTTRSARKITPRAFPTGDLETDTLYGAASGTAKDMFPDVDELTSELVHDAESLPEHEQEAETTKTKSSGFLRGFTLAILFCIIIGALYLFAPVISEYVPQAAGVLNGVTAIVDQLMGAVAPLIDMIKGLIG